MIYSAYGLPHTPRRRKVWPHGARLGGRSKYPRLSALGVRVEQDNARRVEIAQALQDIGENVELPAGDYVSAFHTESLLLGFAPDDLEKRINAFLSTLSG